jgi:hypothetical protein
MFVNISLLKIVLSIHSFSAKVIKKILEASLKLAIEDSGYYFSIDITDIGHTVHERAHGLDGEVSTTNNAY